MQIACQHQNLVAAKQDVLVLGVCVESWHKGPVAELNKALGGALVRAAQEQSFSGKAKQQLMWVCDKHVVASRIALVGLGPKQQLNAQALVRLGGQAARLAQSVQAKSLCIAAPAEAEEQPELAAAMTRGVVLGGYRYTAYKSEAPKKALLAKIVLQLPAQAAHQQQVRFAQAVAEGTLLARDLVNEPPNVLYPESFAKRAQTLGKKAGVKVAVLEPKELKRRGMELLLAVGQGSIRPPRLVHLSYTGPKIPKGQKPIALIGKGITYDSGGLCIKTCEGQGTMKMDMGGAATVLASVITAARLKLPIEVHGVLAMAENMPGHNAFRCGDVLRSAQGTTVEINNTDAEGRLVLADALHFAQTQTKPGCMIDVATLTGACMVALGPHTVGMFSNTDSLAEQLKTASETCGEDFWRLPLTGALRSQLNSDVADMRNTGERYGGAITAALFLQEFVGKTAWAHLDIAGPAWTGEDQGPSSKGGTGVGVATLVTFLNNTGGRARGSNG
jgi:leucyl aminopeptidase